MKGKKTGGRQKGTANRVTLEARVFCASIVDDPVYQARLRRRALAGTLAPALEQMIWYYAKGKPSERTEQRTDDAEIVRRLQAARGRATQSRLSANELEHTH
jgi:hypothetical protein